MPKDNIRLLAAIMFTDMVGYSAIMQENEELAKSLRDRHRKVLEELISEYQGRILQYYGDGTLSMFGSAIEAAKCSIQIQKELQTEPKVPLRIGIHIGDIVYEDDGVYGDGVNIASRVESLGVPGSILVSEKVFDEIKNHPVLRAESLGTFALKNIRKPLEIFALKSPGLIIPTPDEVRSKVGISYKSIAVLPFVNMSSDKDNEYFSDGITEELLNALTKLNGLNVTSRTSSFAFKGKNMDIRDIGKQLGVSTVLEGSVRKAGNKVRITAQLINTTDGYHLWSETFDRGLEDIFEVQDEISKKIANKLREKLTVSNIEEPLVKEYTHNVEAYNLYLKGVHHWNKWLPDEIKKAIKIFREVIEMEPKFALPYSRLSGCYAYMGATGFMKPELSYPKAKECAEKAIELDGNLSESHNSIAMVKLFYEWDWEGCERSFKRSLEINPSNADTYHYYHLYLIAVNRFDEAVAAIEKAHMLDPLNLAINASLATAYHGTGRLEDAIEQFKKTLDIDPDFRPALYGLGWVYLELEQFDLSLKYFQGAQEKTGNDFRGITQLGFLYGRMGENEKALELIEKLKERSKLEPDSSLNMDFAVVYAGLKDYDKVFEYLNRAYEEHSGGLLFLRSRNWKEIHSDPRFTELMKKIGWE